MSVLLLLLTVAATVCTGLIGGVFFAFSVFVMKALAELPAEQGIAAMQRINVTVLNPLFLGSFLGAVPLLGLAAVFAIFAGPPQALVWLLLAALVYTGGSVGVTIAFNVPRNRRLARLAANSAEGQDYWRVYLQEWLFWNHVRTVASLVAAACGVVAIAG